MRYLKLFLPFVLAVITFLNLHSQITNLGEPVSWNGKFPNTNIPNKLMPSFNKSQIDAEDLINDALKDRPWRFGYKYNVNFTTKNSGVWTILPNGDQVWQLSIECRDALTINLLFENFNLPKGAYLYLFDINKTNRVGAYTSKNNRKDGELGTELVHGNKIIIEYYEPYSLKD